MILNAVYLQQIQITMGKGKSQGTKSVGATTVSASRKTSSVAIGSGGVMNKALSFLQVSNSKYTDETAISVVKTPQGNWSLYYDGQYTGQVVGKNALNESQLLASGKYRFIYQRFLQSRDYPNVC